MNDPLAETEGRSPHTRGLDELATPALVALLAAESRRAVDAVAAASVAIAAAVDDIVARMQRGGTLHYVGAGTSGRLGFLDAAEWVPTFGVPAGTVRAMIAGGADALVGAVEGAEDDAHAGEREILARVTADDAVVGISASGGAPYVVAALAAARACGALTIAVVNATRSPLERVAERTIVLATGPEPIAGSTRMNAATAQKLALNSLSTAVMVRRGRVYDNLMIDLVATNEKLRRRAVRIVAEIASVDEGAARELIRAADGSSKVAVVMACRSLGADPARALLQACGGSLRAALRKT